MDRLWSTDLELDLAHERLTLYAAKHCAGHVAPTMDHYGVVPLRRGPLGEYYFPIELDGHKIEAIFATGQRATTLTSDVARRVYHIEQQASGESADTSSGGGAPHHAERTMRLTTSAGFLADEPVVTVEPFADIPDSHCRIARKDDGIGYTGCFNRYPLHLGLELLEKLHIYLATAENVMFVNVAATGTAPP